MKNTGAFGLSGSFSILQRLARQEPVITNSSKGKVRNQLSLPDNIQVNAEGGLRTLGYFKCSELDQPLVSVITVVLNGEQYLEETIQSVVNQTYNNVEYIIIDGGSDDGTLDIIRKYDDRVDFWVSEKDDGIADAFNKGISLCAGDIIGIINADDWYELDAIKKIVECKKHSAVFCGNVQYWDKYKKDYLFLTNIFDLPKEMTVNHPAVFVSKNIYKAFGVFDSRYIYAMDYELLLRFYKKGVEFVAIDSVLSNMRLAGVSDINWAKSFREVRLAKIQHGEFFLVALGYNIKQLIRKKIAYLLSSIGFESLVTLYRRKHSIIKKQKSG
ncbi:MAG: glycosyltransferase [Thiotrichaceae bacterium]|nr:glycosyltransferase [Thiotrichaceae bacterium]